MQEFERFAEAYSKLVAAAAECVTTFCEAISTLCTALPIESIKVAAVYAVAAKEHGDWVHRANYSKKKRIRKKYHDKIMRQYWRADA